MGFEISFMPKKENYLEIDKQVLDVTEHEAKGVWDKITADYALYKTVKKDGKIIKQIDFRFCKTCFSRVEFCHCGERELGMVMIDRGVFTKDRSESFKTWLAGITPHKRANRQEVTA